MERKFLDWLLSEENPGVRAATLIRILGKDAHDPEVVKARQQVNLKPPVSEILAMQSAQGWWHIPRLSFSPILKTTPWQLIFLAQLGADGRHDGIQKAGRLVLEKMLNSKGSFRSESGSKRGGKYGSDTYPCYQALLLEAFLLLDAIDPERAQLAANKLIELVLDKKGRCCCKKGSHVCPWGLTKALRTLRLCQAQKMDIPNLEEAKVFAAEYLLSYDLASAAYPREGKANHRWFKFGFPRSYCCDILEVTEALVLAGYHAEVRLKPALKFIQSKKQTDGRWLMEFTLNGNMLVDVELQNQPSRWVTMKALYVLQKSGY